MPSIISAGTTSGTSLNLSGDTSGVLQLQTNGTTAAVTIDTSQNVGIGTASPAQKLHVTSSSSTYIQVQNTGNSVLAYYGVDTAGGWMGTGSNHYAAFYTNNTERMRIDSSGRVGIGVTPSPWSNFTVLQISSIGALAANDFGSGNTQIRLFCNDYWDGANFRYITSNPAAMYSINGREHIWTSGASGTAGNIISFVEQLRINSNGNLVLQGGTTTANGIGITFPATQSASSDANTLDDYEEGTWTPIIGGTGGQSGQSYSGQEGHYTKVGRVVTVTFRVVLSAKGTITGSAVITGLPFTIPNTITYAAGVTSWENLATNWTSVFLKAGAGSTYATIDGTKSAVSASIVATTSDIGNSTQFNGSFTYFV